jgi:hypothetical protein
MNMCNKNEKVFVKIEVSSPNKLLHKPFNNAFEAVEYLLIYCTSEERISLFSNYCKGCGTDKLPCHCENDE